MTIYTAGDNMILMSRRAQSSWLLRDGVRERVRHIFMDIARIREFYPESYRDHVEFLWNTEYPLVIKWNERDIPQEYATPIYYTTNRLLRWMTEVLWEFQAEDINFDSFPQRRPGESAYFIEWSMDYTVIDGLMSSDFWDTSIADMPSVRTPEAADIIADNVERDEEGNIVTPEVERIYRMNGVATESWDAWLAGIMQMDGVTNAFLDSAYGVTGLNVYIIEDHLATAAEVSLRANMRMREVIEILRRDGFSPVPNDQGTDIHVTRTVERGRRQNSTDIILYQYTVYWQSRNHEDRMGPASRWFNHPDGEEGERLGAPESEVELADDDTLNAILDIADMARTKLLSYGLDFPEVEIVAGGHEMTIESEDPRKLRNAVMIADGIINSFINQAGGKAENVGIVGRRWEDGENTKRCIFIVED